MVKYIKWKDYSVIMLTTIDRGIEGSIILVYAPNQRKHDRWG